MSPQILPLTHHFAQSGRISFDTGGTQTMNPYAFLALVRLVAGKLQCPRKLTKPERFGTKNTLDHRSIIIKFRPYQIFIG
ncbi:MAG TPA: hypothetical protein DD856_13980 [Sulfobacillus sp.]|nr:hypothetical protein [Sulfobacillus sp.]